MMTPIQDIAQKPFSYLQDGTYERDEGDVRTRVIYMPPFKMTGYNEQGFCIHIRDVIVVRKINVLHDFPHISIFPSLFTGIAHI